MKAQPASFSFCFPPPLHLRLSDRVCVSKFGEMDGDSQQRTNLFDELCALIFALLRSPHLFPPSVQPLLPPLQPSSGAVSSLYRQQQRSRFTPASLASLLFGASLALMLCGSVTFVLGCILMPWIIGFVIFFYFVGVISSLSDFGAAIMCLSVPAPAKSSPREVSDHFF